MSSRDFASVGSLSQAVTCSSVRSGAFTKSSPRTRICRSGSIRETKESIVVCRLNQQRCGSTMPVSISIASKKSESGCCNARNVTIGGKESRRDLSVSRSDVPYDNGWRVRWMYLARPSKERSMRSRFARVVVIAGDFSTIIRGNACRRNSSKTERVDSFRRAASHSDTFLCAFSDCSPKISSCTA